METKQNLYQYVERNLLNDPEYYMYSGFGGGAFLESYISSRNECLRYCEEQYLDRIKNEIQSTDSVFRDLWHLLTLKQQSIYSKEVLAVHDRYHNIRNEDAAVDSDKTSIRAYDDLDSEVEINTQGILMSCLFSCLNENGSNSDLLSDWLNLYIKRFEVTKKLYSTYTKKMKPVGEDFCSVGNYALLSISSLLFYEKKQNLKMLNCALKLNDLICSIYKDISKLEDIYLIMTSLCCETGFIKQLALNHGVKV